MSSLKEKKIVFMGTPDFAVASLDALIKAGANIVGVITSPDRPAGRGHKLQESSVKKYALSKQLNILQPINLKDPEFIENLRRLEADLQVVVAFRMLPEIVWNMPPLGTFNLHASLLPQYRGAAPLNWAIINGETITGVSTFLLDKQIDTGQLLFQEEITVGINDTVGDLHDEAMEIGARLVVKTAKCIIDNQVAPIDQSKLIKNENDLKHAPKLFKENTCIHWQCSAKEIHNLVRGLSPYPGAWSNFKSESIEKVKIFKTMITDMPSKVPGTIILEKERMFVGTKDHYIELLEWQMPGKRRMKTSEIIRGANWKSEHISFK